ncbi:MAG: Ku protein [Acidimicrobiia bacterium]|nr:Ku protein [Acidimicrobiia bacterium]
MARPVWKGSISFGLVNMGVKAFSAVRDHEVHFHQLDKKSGARVRYVKVSGKSGDPLEKDDIEMGYEVKKGKYVTFSQRELNDLQPASTRTLDVSDFVALEDVDPIYYDRTYWLVPDGEGADRAYRLLLAAMEDEQRVGIGTVVMRNKQYLAAIRPLDGALAMSTLRFDDDVVGKSEIDGVPRKAKVDAKELKLASQIIDALASDWKPSRYKDTYTDELRKRIERKEKGKDVVEEGEEQETVDTSNVTDLMAVLQESVERAKKGRSTRKRTTKAAKARKSA